MRQQHLYRFYQRTVLLLLAAVIFMGLASVLKGETQDTIISAMKDEMDRSMKSLKIEDMDKPYYLEYTILDYYQWSIAGSFGALTQSEKNHQRGLKVDLRVGDYALDNTGYVDRGSMFSTFMGGYGLVVLEDDYNALRRSLWLATDQAYKDALKQLAGKKAYLKTRVQEEEIPDFSKETSLQKIAPAKILEFDQAKWESVVKNLSAVFRQFPAVNESHVDLQVRLLHKYYVNSEGTVFRQPEILVALVANASTQAEDGVKLKHYIPFYALSLEQLPGEKELTEGIKGMAGELTALASAPVVDNYIGPVLFTRQAAAELFTQVLVPQLSGQRPPVSDMQQIEQMASSSKLAQWLNRKILPREISIVDDPLKVELNKTPLVGSYIVDDQGVAARPVNLVENGILKTMLMSRRPRKEITQSNGHARAGIMGNPGAQIGNLLVTANKGKSFKELKEELLQYCKDQGLEFGLIIKVLDNPSITGVDDAMSFFSRAQQSEPGVTNPILVYRVYVKDGREELVRGISIGDFTVSNLRDIAAVGDDVYVMNRMMGSAGSAMGGYFSLFGTGQPRDMGIPASIAVPSLLFEEIEFKKDEGKRDKPPLLTHPFFPKK